MKTDKIAVHLPTGKDFETFLKYYENPKELELRHWQKCRKKFCIDLQDGCFCEKKWYESNNYTIINIHDYIKQFHNVVEIDETPDHYKTNTFDARDLITAYGLNFNRGNVIKYVARAGKKGNELEDLKKAKNYLDYEIKRLENGHNGSDN